MIHARKDYQRIQDPSLTDPSLLGEGSTPIGEDEPVFLLRAKDKFFVQMLIHYWQMLYKADNLPDEMRRAIGNHIALAEEWQYEHGTKTPDMPIQP
jgi:hypothetical protein